MRHHAARALTRLYDPSWQRQYGAEFEALLLDLPCTPCLVVDVVPRALATRRHAAALLAAVLLLLCVGGSQITRPHPTSQLAVHVQQHRAALAPCRSYSSVSDSGVIVRQQCLD